MKEKTELESCSLLNDSILIELLDEDDVTKSGIILQGSIRETKGTVVKTGPGVFTQNGEQLPMQVKVGDVVMLNKSKDNYKDVSLDEVKYKFTNEREVTIVLQR